MSVDVVIPTVGRPSLATALQSVRGQSHAAANTIVVLDKPSARAMVEGMLNGETLVVTDGIGGGGARQAGVDASTSRDIAFLDDDDWWEARKLERQISLMNHRGARWSLTGATFHAAKSSRIVPTDRFNPDKSLIDYTLERRSLRYGKTFVQSSTLVAARELLLVEGWDRSLPRHQDWDLVARLSRREPAFVYLHEPLTHVAQGSAGSISKAGNWRQSADWLETRAGDAGSRARADFAVSIVLRSALAAGESDGVRWTVRYLRKNMVLPHAASAVVGLSALAQRLRS